MPLTKQSPIQNQGSQPLMSKRGAVEKQYSDSDLNFNSVPYSEQTPGYSTKLSPDQIRSVNKYSDKQIPVPEDEPNNSFSSINDSYNKMFSDYQKHSFDPLKKAENEYEGDKRYNYRKGYSELWDKATESYGNVNFSELKQFEKAEGYKKDLLKNPATSLFDERKNYISRLDKLWNPKQTPDSAIRPRLMPATRKSKSNSILDSRYKITNETPISF
jgi:hypothetical protein